MKVLKIGIIGLGNICEKAYLPVITSLDDVELIFCTRNINKLKYYSEKYRVAEYVTSVDELINKNIEAAFIHTATESHAEIIEKLLNNNIHVYVDKPISYSYEDAVRLSKLAKSKNKVFMVGFNRRFAPMYSNLENMGLPQIIKLEKNRLDSPKDPTIFVLDDFIHVLDTIRFLAKDNLEVLNVSAKKKDGLLYNLIVTLGNDKTTCIAMMNRESGANEEVLEYYTSGTKVIVRDLINSNILSENTERLLKFNDWDTILYRRGFEVIIKDFLNAVKNHNQDNLTIEDSLETHKLCFEIFNKIHEIKEVK